MADMRADCHQIQSRSAIRRQAPMRWRRERLRDLDLA